MESSASGSTAKHHEGEKSTYDSAEADHPQVRYEEEKSEGTSFSQQSRRPNLSSLEIPERSLESSLNDFTKGEEVTSGCSSKGGLPPRPNSAMFKSSMRHFFPQRSLRTRNLSENGETTVLIIPDTPVSDAPVDKPSTSSFFSLNKTFFTTSSKATSSLPVTPLAMLGSTSMKDRDLNGSSEESKLEVKRHIRRSLSVPVSVKLRSLKRLESGGSRYRMILASPHTPAADAVLVNGEAERQIDSEDGGEDIPEEDAVCRICMIELGEGGDTLKLECSCKGDLALAHLECVVKWFCIKGNHTCDICGQAVRNLPVTLLKIHNPQTSFRQTISISQQREVIHYRVWQEAPVLIMVSMLAYFCFLEQLLVSEFGALALAISLPFSCLLGLLSSMIASTMVSRGYIWAYSSFQFAIVILFAHVFYAVLHVNAILSVMLSSFTGFGTAISINSLILEYFKWSRTRQLRSSLQRINQAVEQQQQERHQQSNEDSVVEATEQADISHNR